MISALFRILLLNTKMHTNRITTLPKLIKTPKQDQINQKFIRCKEDTWETNESISWQKIRHLEYKPMCI